jgi:hypothetical protein
MRWVARIRLEEAFDIGVSLRPMNVSGIRGEYAAVASFVSYWVDHWRTIYGMTISDYWSERVR